MNNRSIGLLGEGPSPLRRWGRVLMIMALTGTIFAVGVAIMAIASA